METQTLQKRLQQELEARMRTNPKYSLRAFARFLRISPGALSEMMKGVRGITPKTIERIAVRLGASEQEKSQWYQSLTGRQISTTEIQKSVTSIEKVRQLNQQEFELVSQWEHFAILNLMDCEGFQWDAKWLAQRLRIQEQVAKMAMERLIQIGCVTLNEKGASANQDYVMSEKANSYVAIRQYHTQMLEKAIQSLQLHGPQEREVSGVSMACHWDDLQKMKMDIREFQERMIQKYYRKNGDDVFHLEVAFFPISEGENL